MSPTFSTAAPGVAAAFTALVIVAIAWCLGLRRGASSPCEGRVINGDCRAAPLAMAIECPGLCEENKTDSELRGRAIFEEAVPREQAIKLAKLAPLAVVPRDGYQGKRDLSVNEAFGGITPAVAADWALKNKNIAEAIPWARSYIEVARRSKLIVQNHFHLKSLYFDYIHLVCRQRTRTAAANVDSHPAHADNCYKNGTTSCIPDAPMYYWRSHSAIAFLHGPEDGGFEGGEFFFAPGWDSDAQFRVRVQPQAGRMVAFTAGAANIHGVDEVKHGTRCALALWFTEDEQRAGHMSELEHAESILGGSFTQPPATNQAPSKGEQLSCAARQNAGICRSDPLAMSFACSGHCDEDKASSVIKERTVKDDVIPNEWSKQLLEFGSEAAVDGDGYGGNIHPFTTDESFGGITPASAAAWAQSRKDGNREKAEDSVRLYIKIVRQLQNIIEEHFGAQSLYLDYAHLTCRKRVGNSLGRRDSHPAHADNCYEKNNECIRESPFFFWRSHSAVLYLHGPDTGNFSGGSFFFTPNFTSQERVRVIPKAGRMVAFSAGSANVHGVESITEGFRCALNVWYTEDESRAAFNGELQKAEAVLAAEEVEPPDANNFMEKFERLCKIEGSEISSEASRGPRWMVPLLDEARALDVETFGNPSGPQLSFIHNFLTKEEATHLIAKAQPNFGEATVYEQGKLLQGVKYRTSTSSWLPDDPKDHILTKVLDRIRVVTGLSLERAEHVQVGRYLSDNQGRYEPHFDWGKAFSRLLETAKSSATPGDGDRIATVILYLSEVESGGRTIFSAEGLSFPPESGSLLFWYNLKPSGQPDELVRHGGCPVLKGTKYIATKWIRERGNEHAFHAALGRQRFWQNWQYAKDHGLGKNTTRSLVVGRSCEERYEAGDCLHSTMSMASACAGFCDDLAVESVNRGRRVLESDIPKSAAERLVRLATKAGIVGDGYGGEAHPSSEYERFVGLTPVAAAKWAASQWSVFGQKADAVEMVRNYLSAVLAVQRLVSLSFGRKWLMLQYVHLTCRHRTKSVGIVTGRDSHGPHADNCRHFSRYCVPLAAFAHWRTHAASLFLQNPQNGTNDTTSELEGGSFFYQPDVDNYSRRAYIRPRLGRLVAYTAGPENFNGVEEVVRGNRCVLQVWFTTNLSIANGEYEMRDAEAILNSTG